MFEGSLTSFSFCLQGFPMSHHAAKEQPKGKEEADDNVAAAKKHMKLAMSDYHVTPRLDYRE